MKDTSGILKIVIKHAVAVNDQRVQNRKCINIHCTIALD